MRRSPWTGSSTPSGARARRRPRPRPCRSTSRGSASSSARRRSRRAAHGYALIAEPDSVDADRFERLAEDGRERLAAGDARGAAERLQEALALWRGEPLADVAYESFARTETSRLEDLRLAALEDRIDAELALGNHAALVPELEALVKEHPTRERVRGQLMLALYRSGRQADALEAYREGRTRLADQLGLDPGPELQRLERAILSQDPELDRPSPPARLAAIRQGRGAPLVVAGGLLLLAAAVAAWIGLSGEADRDLAEPNSLAVIDPGSNEIEATVPTGVDPAEVDVDGKYVWVANRGDGTVSKVDAQSRTVVATRSPDSSVAGLAVGAGGVWIGDTRREHLVRMDPDLQAAERSVRVAPGAGAFRNVDRKPGGRRRGRGLGGPRIRVPGPGAPADARDGRRCAGRQRPRRLGDRGRRGVGRRPGRRDARSHRSPIGQRGHLGDAGGPGPSCAGAGR